MNTAVAESSPSFATSSHVRSNRFASQAIPGVYIGTMAGFRELPDIDLYNLLVPVGDHPVGSTVSRKTLERHGYRLPSIVRRFSGEPLQW